MRIYAILKMKIRTIKDPGDENLKCSPNMKVEIGKQGEYWNPAKE
jgi:hypothetical protein